MVVRRSITVARLHMHQRQVGILVVGDVAFRRKLSAAFVLLQQRTPDRFRVVQENIYAVIQDDSRGDSYTDISICPPLVVFKTDTASNLEWCASALVHESRHIEQVRRSKLSHHGQVMLSEVLGTNAEIEANSVQAETLQELAAPSYMVDYLLREQGRNWNQRFGAKLLSVTNVLLDQMPMKHSRPQLWEQLLRIRTNYHDLEQCDRPARSSNQPARISY